MTVKQVAAELGCDLTRTQTVGLRFDGQTAAGSCERNDGVTIAIATFESNDSRDAAESDVRELADTLQERADGSEGDVAFGDSWMAFSASPDWDADEAVAAGPGSSPRFAMLYAYAGLGAAGVTALAFWLGSIIQALRTDDPTWAAAGQNKVLYVLLMIFTGLLGTTLYAAIARPPLKKQVQTKGLPAACVAGIVTSLVLIVASPLVALTGAFAAYAVASVAGALALFSFLMWSFARP